jgi:hypothetical protein
VQGLFFYCSPGGTSHPMSYQGLRFPEEAPIRPAIDAEHDRIHGPGCPWHIGRGALEVVSRNDLYSELTGVGRLTRYRERPVATKAQAMPASARPRTAPDCP